MRVPTLLWFALAAGLGCGESPEGTGAASSSAGAGGSGCGVPACDAAGVPADGCPAGFEADEDHGCTAILPADDCAPGTFAVPGETACHDVAPCAEGSWGDIPVDAT